MLSILVAETHSLHEQANAFEADGYAATKARRVSALLGGCRCHKSDGNRRLLRKQVCSFARLNRRAYI
jgi:hypothetical protein